MFTRQHYCAVAESIHDNRFEICPDTPYGRGHEDGRQAAAKDIAEALADLFAADNKAFNREQFLKACGV